MTLAATIVPESVPFIEHDPLELLLLDQEWVDGEFAAIMTVSGFGDRIVSAVLTPLPPDVALRWWERDRIFGVAVPAAARGRDARVRSPPTWR